MRAVRFLLWLLLIGAIGMALAAVLRYVMDAPTWFVLAAAAALGLLTPTPSWADRRDRL